MTRSRGGLALATALVLASCTAGGCRGPEPELAPAPVGAMGAGDCAPAAGPLAPGIRAEALAGDHHLVLLATTGPMAGASAAGTLRLRAFGAAPAPITAPDGSGARYPLFGGTDVDVAAVGAVANGEVAPVDPAGPGVLAVEWPRGGGPPDAREILLRLGAEGNRDDRARFDGAYLSLFVEALDEGGFAGRWESGSGARVAGGRFCAWRIAASGAGTGVDGR